MYKQIVNAVSLISLIQGVNLVIPLLIYPYLVSVYGLEIYGQYLYVLTFVSIMSVFVNLSFNVTCARRIAEGEAFSAVYYNVVAVKIIIALVCFFWVGMYIYAIENIEYTLFLICSLLLLYEIFFPYWYYIGKEKYKNLALNVLLSRVVFLASIFIFIDGANIAALALINSLSMLLSLLICFIELHVFQREKVGPAVVQLKEYWNESFQVFQGQAVSQLFELIARLFVGAVMGPILLSYYDFADKIVRIFKMPINALGAVLYPLAVKERDFPRLWYFTKVFMLIYVVLYIFLYSVLDYFIEIIFPVEMLDASGIVKLYLIVAFAVIIKQFLFFQLLIPLGYIGIFRISAWSGFLIFLAMMLVYLVFDISRIDYLVISIVLSELFISVSALMLMRFQKVELNRGSAYVRS